LHGSPLLSRAARSTLAVRGTLPCPQAYRADSVDLAEKALAAALASGDANRVFVARGDVQRLTGRRL